MANSDDNHDACFGFGRHGILRAVGAAVACAVLLAFLFNGLWLWFNHESLSLAACVSGRGLLLPLGRLLHAALIVPPALFAWFWSRRVRSNSCHGCTLTAVDHDPAPPVLLAALVFFMVSGITSHPWFYFMRWASTGTEGLVGRVSTCLVLVLALAIPLTPFALRRRNWSRWLLAALVLAQIVAFAALMKTTHGMPIYSDDHPSFLFRLHEFAHTFPRRIDYNPCWNAGVVNWTSTSSGTSGPGLIFLPLWRWLPVHEIYTPLFGVLFIVVAPWLNVAALRAIRANWAAAASAGLISLCASRYCFLWLLHFGTIGSCFAVSFLPLFAALTYRILVMREHGRWTLAAWVASAFFLIQWPPGAIMAATLAPGALLNVRRWRWRSVWRLAAAAGVLALLLAPAVLLALTQGRDLLGYVGKDAVAADSSRAPLPGLSVWWRFLLDTMGKRLVEANPLVVFLGVAGAFALPWKRLRAWFAPPLVVLFLIAAFGPLLARRMQLERMALPAVVIAVVPASLWIGRILRGGRPMMAVGRAIVVSLLLVGIINVRQLYRGRGYAPFHEMPTQISALADWANANVPGDGRMMFLGKNVHTYGGGHIAYMPVLAGREMMASDYYGFPPGMIDEKYPPRDYRLTRAAGIHDFARLHRVTHVVACREGYIDEFKLRQAPQLFREIRDLNNESLFIFEVLDPAESLFAKGGGTVRATFNRIDVDGLAGQDEAVIRYNWDDRLRVVAPAEIFPVEIANGIRFIGIRPNGASSVRIGLAGFL